MSGTAPAITVVKIGGGLSRIPQILERVCRAVENAAQDWPLVVVPGGGPLADAVRDLDTRLRLSPDVAHWMAILAMDQYGHVLASRIRGAVLVEEPGGIREALTGTGCVVLAPSRWMRAADVLPHTWDVTSDSIAAFIAGALDARQLILIKPDSSANDQVDPHFFSALPAGMPWTIVGSEHIEELSRELSR
jgi:5-(aminomethyl)-3-furanmethanol phosphate kinase